MFVCPVNHLMCNFRPLGAQTEFRGLTRQYPVTPTHFWHSQRPKSFLHQFVLPKLKLMGKHTAECLSSAERVCRCDGCYNSCSAQESLLSCHTEFLKPLSQLAPASSYAAKSLAKGQWSHLWQRRCERGISFHRKFIRYRVLRSKQEALSVPGQNTWNPEASLTLTIQFCVGCAKEQTEQRLCGSGTPRSDSN